LRLMAAESNEPVFLVKPSGAVAFRVHKEPHDSGMLCNKERSADCLGQQQTAISVTLARTVNSQSCEPNGRQPVRRVSLCVFLGKMLSADFTER